MERDQRKPHQCTQGHTPHLLLSSMFFSTLTTGCFLFPRLNGCKLLEAPGTLTCISLEFLKGDPAPGLWVYCKGNIQRKLFGS